MRRVFPLWAVVLAMFVVATSAYGGYHFFSPIPYWDQWDGYIGFYRSLMDGRADALWVPHMEHRIVLSRILFFLDIVAFGGQNISTVIVNYLLVLAIAVLILFQCARGRYQKYSLWLVGGLTFGFLFLWCQNENLKWGFQSQSFAVYLFAFCAFAVYSGADDRNRRVFWAVVLAAISVVSMGNGIAAFGVMIFQAVLQRRPWREPLILAIAGAVSAALYFHGYIKPVLPVDPVTAQLTAPRLKFLLLFLGNPLYYAKPSLLLCAVVGFIYLGICLLTLCLLLRRGGTSRYQSFLAAIVCMVLIAAAGAANGRWMLGIQFAISSRYTTPMLMGYLALTLLLLDMATVQRNRTGVTLVSLLLLSAVAGYQIQVFADNGYQYEWKLAVLGQKIGLDHPAHDATIYPAVGHDVYVENAKFAASQGIGPYGSGWLHDAGKVRFDARRIDPELCQGFVDTRSTDEVGEVVNGWAVARDSGAKSLLILLVDDAGQTLGYGVTGANRPDVKKAIEGAPLTSGWTAFARRGEGSLNTYVYTAGKFCPLRELR